MENGSVVAVVTEGLTLPTRNPEENVLDRDALNQGKEISISHVEVTSSLGEANADVPSAALGDDGDLKIVEAARRRDGVVGNNGARIHKTDVLAGEESPEVATWVEIQ